MGLAVIKDGQLQIIMKLATGYRCFYGIFLGCGEGLNKYASTTILHLRHIYNGETN